MGYFSSQGVNQVPGKKYGIFFFPRGGKVAKLGLGGEDFLWRALSGWIPGRLPLALNMITIFPFRNRHRRGSGLIEAAGALALLTLLALLLMRGTMNVISARQWTVMQNVTDAYLTFETALAERTAFEEFLGNDSLWPLDPRTASAEVEICRLIDGRVVTGTVTRTRVPDPGNLPEAGGEGSLATNPARMEAYKLQSHLVYAVGGRNYVKSRTVVRSR